MRVLPIVAAVLLSSLANGNTPTEIASPDAHRGENPTVFFPAAELHKGNVLQIRAPHLLGDETLILARCDGNCSNAQVVSVWRHGFRSASGIDNRVIRSNINLREDGRYFFWLIKNSDCYVDAWGCHTSAWPGVLTYGKPQALGIVSSSQDGALFKLKYDSGTLVYVRQVDVNTAAPAAG
jgi:hypothetical protein